MAGPEPPKFLSINDYAVIVDTDDEWEGLIGVIHEIYDKSGYNVPTTRFGQNVVLWIPTDKEEQKRFNLLEVNTLTSYVRQELNFFDELRAVPKENLEWVDSNDF